MTAKKFNHEGHEEHEEIRAPHRSRCDHIGNSRAAGGLKR
jgi:hypothetical protein